MNQSIHAGAKKATKAKQASHHGRNGAIRHRADPVQKRNMRMAYLSTDGRA